MGLDQAVLRINNPALLRVPLTRAMQKSVLYLSGLAKRQAPVDTGRLRSSITTAIDPAPPFPRWGKVGTNVTYAAFAEFGTRPHWPPVGALQPWAQRHGFGEGLRADFLVRRAIARRGTRAQPYLRPALQKSMAQIRRIFAQAMLEIRASINGR